MNIFFIAHLIPPLYYLFIIQILQRIVQNSSKNNPSV
uniref:Uncharacterized protein n=1 Tax=Myoviridae sp. ctkfK18 TaxID=2825165 RepID=A0A8S5VGZ3_9CAUD|nr:MAG TPA: hypothetical protein [Myoviridae sp. ctkfK18]